MSAVQVSYEQTGPEGAPVVVLAASLGATRAMWRHQVPVLAERFRVVAFDARGHGRSPVPPGPYALDDLVDDVVALLDRLGVERAHVAGLSLGGMTAMRLAAREPDRVDRVALLCTSAHLGPRSMWEERARIALDQGTGALAPTVVARWTTPGFAAEHPEVVAELEEMVAGIPGEGYAACCAAIADMDLRADLPRIAAPTVVLSGAEDPATPPEHQRAIAGAIPGARLVSLTPAAHVPTAEQPDRVAAVLVEHFSAGDGAR